MSETLSGGEDAVKNSVRTATGIRGRRLVLFGLGNVGNELVSQLPNNTEFVNIVREKGVFDEDMQLVGPRKDWKKHVDKTKPEAAFITIPSIGKGDDAYEYAMHFLKQGLKVVMCEKAAVAFRGADLDKYPDLIRYSASVGGSTRMPAALSEYRQHSEVKEIKAVVNGTLNYLAEHALEKGQISEGVVAKMRDDGYAEPGATSLHALIEGEMSDIKYKAAILANLSGIFKERILPSRVGMTDPRPEDLTGAPDARRAIVHINKDGVSAGFREPTRNLWLPVGINNVLVVNGEQVVSGPGAGPDKTARAMIQDFRELFPE